MDNGDIRDHLARIAAETHEAQQGAQRAYDMTRRLEKALALPFEEPETEDEEGPPLPEVVKERKRSIVWEHSIEGLKVGLTREPRASLAGQRLADVPIDAPFIEQFMTEAGGVRETVCVLHNGCPDSLGAIRIPKLSIRTHDGREIFPYQGAVTIRPGGMLVVRDYFALNGFQSHQGTLQEMFWHQLVDAPDSVPGIVFDDKLHDELFKQLAHPVTVGPYDMAWDERGDAPGGQGIEPDAMDWRHCASGYALAALTAYRTANRCTRVMTDESGAFTWDEETAYTSVGDFMPKEFDWEPQDATEDALAKWWNIDGQHFHRAYRDALWLFKQTKHPFMGWYLKALWNFQSAANYGTAGDNLSHHWWSLEKKLAQPTGRNEWCGRQGVHEARFVRECVLAFLEWPGAEVDWHADLFEQSIDRHGRAHQMPASANPAASASWHPDDETTNVRELQLALSYYRMSGSRKLMAAAEKLHAWLGTYPDPVWNYTQSVWGKSYDLYDGSKDMGMVTHGDAAKLEIYGSTKGMLDVARTRGVEAGGAQPLNYCNDPSMWATR